MGGEERQIVDWCYMRVPLVRQHGLALDFREQTRSMQRNVVDRYREINSHITQSEEAGLQMDCLLNALLRVQIPETFRELQILIDKLCLAYLLSICLMALELLVDWRMRRAMSLHNKLFPKDCFIPSIYLRLKHNFWISFAEVQVQSS